MNLIDIMKNDIHILTNSQKIIGTLLVTGISMVIVFLVLIIISFSLNIMNRLICTQDKKETKKVNKNKDSKDNKELIAVISAVIAASLGTSTNNIVVRNIVRVKDEESNWSKNGRIEQMNNFNFFNK
ncbi:OadG family protein [Tepidibacter thalassicus]|uniref:Na+-transporting methylmalonyl-CoA/oxaloacetate decarboxylase, gamma subunit n=1 Tax=Tepidibacter thalassicus DSM 15285 TaxID=1123350 RepID=A0A1M5TB06_9FIRM|nr:OadG family protein [Tepidibacter thalassicus]SHH47868.1 Na+-transporting methylmalonyl-CoA/oxaloacetate decarboxylase, gamma subunit [Tepidibacter thalassicus DSM 15285]